MQAMCKLLLLAVALAVLPAFGQEYPCTANETMVDAVRCEESRLKAADVVLNQEYRQLVEGLGGSSEPHEREASDLLVRAQRNWVVFRELDCKAMFVARGGATLAPWYQLRCMRTHAELRTKQLREFHMN